MKHLRSCGLGGRVARRTCRATRARWSRVDGTKVQEAGTGKGARALDAQRFRRARPMRFSRATPVTRFVSGPWSRPVTEELRFERSFDHPASRLFDAVRFGVRPRADDAM